MCVRKQGGFSDCDDEPLVRRHAHMLLMLHHLIHHQLLHAHVRISVNVTERFANT